MREKTAYRLAAMHPHSANLQWDIKELIPELDAQKLLMKGFFDCSWGNDEVPSYYIEGVEDLHVLACDEIDDSGQRISDQITYCLSKYGRQCEREYLSIDDAIAEYIKIAASTGNLTYIYI